MTVSMYSLQHDRVYSGQHKNKLKLSTPTHFQFVLDLIKNKLKMSGCGQFQFIFDHEQVGSMGMNSFL